MTEDQIVLPGLYLAGMDRQQVAGRAPTRASWNEADEAVSWHKTSQPTRRPYPPNS